MRFCRPIKKRGKDTINTLLFSVIRIHEGRNVGRKEGNVLFNDALNTFYLRLYGVRHMIKDHSDSEIARVLLYASSHRQDNTYHGFVTPVGGHRLEREIAQWVHPMKDRSDDPSHNERTLLPRSDILLLYGRKEMKRKLRNRKLRNRKLRNRRLRNKETKEQETKEQETKEQGD